MKRQIAQCLAVLAGTGLVACVGPALDGALPAGAVTGYAVIASPSLNARSGPGTSFSVVGSLPHGAALDISCQVQGGTNVNGNATWDRLSNGWWISDYWTNTPSFNSYIPGVGDCNAATPTPPPTPPASSSAQNAISWARSQIGATGWNGWCDKFVANAYGKTASGYPTAYDHYLNLKNRGLIHGTNTGTPPLGALVFFGPARVNSNDGHVMLSEGNGSYITAAARVKEVNLSWPGAPYIGWSYANPEWPGR